MRDLAAHQRWTQANITELRDRVQLGEAMADIVAALGRAPADVAAMMGRLRLRCTPVMEPALGR